MVFLEFMPLVFFSLLGFWQVQTGYRQLGAILLMLAAGTALITGLAWYDSFNDTFGLGISICIVLYSFVCLIIGLIFLVSRSK